MTIMKDNLWIKDNYFTLISKLLMFLVPVIAALIAACTGRIFIPVGEVFKTIGNIFTGDEALSNYSIIVNLRVPRIIMAVIVGAGLSCAGNTFQSLFSNPLATPDILGVTSGTCLGAIIAILLERGMLEIQLTALAFGLVAVWITMKLSGSRTDRSLVFLVLSGVIISSLFNALGSLLKYTADPTSKLPEITYWLLGSFASSTYTKIAVGTPLIIIGIIVIYFLRWQLNIISLSEDEAKASGIDIKKIRVIFIIAATLITASSVSMAGQVGWIGLLVPHLARMLVGSNNRYVIPVGISLGASFMLVIDTLSRSISVIELPLSILTAIIGAPMFILLLRRSRDNLK